MFLIHKKIQLCKIENPDSGVREVEMILRIFCQTIILKRRLRKKREEIPLSKDGSLKRIG